MTNTEHEAGSSSIGASSWLRCVAWGLAVAFAIPAGCADGTASAPEPIVAISGAEERTCALDRTGALYCWGATLDRRDDDFDLTPVRFGDERWSAVSVGTSHACGIKRDGTLWCWGGNTAGQLGSRQCEDHPEPLQVGTASNWDRVGVGGGLSCAIDIHGALTCWGGLDYGQPDCSTTQSLPPTLIPGTWVDVSAHYYAVHALAADGSLWRIGDTTSSSNPSGGLGRLDPIEAGGTWRSMATGLGATQVCGVLSSGRLVCVPSDGTSPTGSSAIDWEGPIGVRDHVCATRTDGSLWCWGLNDRGQCGQGIATTEPIEDPVRVGIDTGWTAVTAGWGMGCGIRDGRVYCWGSASYLGRGELVEGSHLPAPVHL